VNVSDTMENDRISIYSGSELFRRIWKIGRFERNVPVFSPSVTYIQHIHKEVRWSEHYFVVLR